MNRFILVALALSLGYFQAGCQSGGNSGKSSDDGSFRRSVDAKTFNDAMSATNNPVILDVRSEGEFMGGYIAGAKNWPIGSQRLEQGLAGLDKNEEVFVYCLSGGRSSSVAGLMQGMGFTKITELRSGIMGWNNAGLPIEMPGAAKPDAISPEAYQKMIAGGTVLVDFYAPWCAPCKKMEPMLDELQKELGDKATIIRINVDENKNLVKQLGVSDIPVFQYIVNGVQQWQHNGFIERATLKEKMGL